MRRTKHSICSDFVLVEDPSKYQVAAEVAVDALFVAFEKFLNVAWKDSMGPVITAKMLHSIQDKSSKSSVKEVNIMRLVVNYPTQARCFVVRLRITLRGSSQK